MSERVTLDYSKLRGRIIEKCGTIGAAAEKTGIRAEQFTDAFKGRRTFTQTEILAICEALDLHKEDIPVYFFET